MIKYKYVYEYLYQIKKRYSESGSAFFYKNIKKEVKTLKRQMKKLIVSAVALSLVIPALSAPKAEAAKKPSLDKKGFCKSR